MTFDIYGTDFTTVDVILIFHSVPERRGFFWRFLKPGFQHVQAWMKFADDLWIQVDGCLEALFVKPYDLPPWALTNNTEKYKPTFLPLQRRITLGKVREPFHFGPVTCVDLTKALLGIRAPLVRTPWQLYKHLTRK
jgi:hypothetical protein